MAKEKFDLIAIDEVVRRAVYEAVAEKMEKHSITQEIIDMGAYDVAKSYIDFLKKKSEKITQTP